MSIRLPSPLPFFAALAEAGYAAVKGDLPVNHVPLLYRTDRYRLVESGMDAFHLRLEGNKGVTWAVLEVRLSGRGVIAFSTHFWWKYNGRESDAIREQNAELLLWRVRELKTRHPDFAVLGGGDRGSLRPRDNTPATSLDHVFVATNAVHALRQVVVTDQDALDVSDHSPVVVDFVLP